ncbi:transporter family-2 protein [Chromohalobacter marismortui]|uniref:Transporter family-2 protein n=1 Tax=Chromohalobacter marismortui TaxID=42055 RepID=A0A4R7NS14_9GAMM|nr:MULTISPECIES: DMT family transporter [Chromohalobacter]MCI0509303.1 DMT family transporter [Chromohalobacter sp.]MCI0593851.1 DMT family transporter [Chromohalobacter sp.]TDU23804.1 transporter family-2 protein [Chromohalobacter marismortui]
MKTIILLLAVLLAGMGLSMEAGLLGPLGKEIGHFSATLSIFLVGGLLLTLALIFSRPRLGQLFQQPRWLLTGGILGPVYVVVLTIATPFVGVGTTMIGILSGQVAASLVIDHFGLLGSERRGVDGYRLLALLLIIAALWLMQ